MRSQTACAILLVALGIGLSTSATDAQAASYDWCGFPIASTPNNAGGFNCPGVDSWWSYASASYPGSGSDLNWIRAALGTGGAPVNGHWAGASYTTFVSICYGNQYVYWSHGQVGQTAVSGAAHSISGHTDDSPNHSNCVGP